MKKFIIATIIASMATMGYAREYEPTEGWPYLFEDFVEGIVYYDNGKAESAPLNVHLLSNVLHFSDGENIMVVKDAANIDSVVCGNIKFLRRANLYVWQLHQTPRIVIGQTNQCEVNYINDTGGAYGISTTSASTQNVASFSDHGNMAALRYREMKENHKNTHSLHVTQQIIFIIDDREICNANKKGVNDILDKEQKKLFKEFLKENKIKWKELDSLTLVAEFLESIIPSYE